MTPAPVLAPPVEEIAAQSDSGPVLRAAATLPLGAAVFTPPPGTQGSPALPPPLAPVAPPSPLEAAAESELAGNEAMLGVPDATAISSPLSRSWSRVSSGLHSAWNRVSQRVRRKAVSSPVTEPGARRRIRLIVIAATSIVGAAALGGLVLGSTHSSDVQRHPQKRPALATPHSTEPSHPAAPSVAKPAAPVLATVTPAERTLPDGPAAATKSDSRSRHAKASHTRHGPKKKLASAHTRAKRAKYHARARHGRKSARIRDRAADTPASGADPATRSRAAYQEGNAKLFSGDTDAAIKAYQEAIRLNRKDPAGYRGLGLAYMQAGKKTAAAKAFARYLKLARSAKDRDIILERIRLLNSQQPDK